MPEALAVLVIFVIAVAAYVAALLSARDPAQQDAAADLATLRQHHAWLQQRLEVARRENWGDEMVAGIAAELDATTRQIARRN